MDRFHAVKQRAGYYCILVGNISLLAVHLHPELAVRVVQACVYLCGCFQLQ